VDPDEKTDFSMDRGAHVSQTIAGKTVVTWGKAHPGKKRYVTKEIYHIQNVNAYHERFKSFQSPFRGVSEIPDYYVAWHRLSHSVDSPLCFIFLSMTFPSITTQYGNAKQKELIASIWKCTLRHISA
jgi:hypothetical protein